MGNRVQFDVKMILSSDTVFGSGYSIPGGEDIAVKIDKKGYPYLSGSTFKGLLRESAINWNYWTEGNDSDIKEIFGESGWSEENDNRRINITSFTLMDKPEYPQECFVKRMLTSIAKDRIALDGSLRMARCIKSGLCFLGKIEIDDSDSELISNALKCIKWAGTMRSRGFGKVRIEYEKIKIDEISEIKRSLSQKGKYIHFKIRNESPLIITDLNASAENTYETKRYIPGMTLRGLIISTIASKTPDLFNRYKKELLSEKVRFLDAFPTKTDKPTLPSIKGFYENKLGKDFSSYL